MRNVFLYHFREALVHTPYPVLWHLALWTRRFNDPSDPHPPWEDLI